MRPLIRWPLMTSKLLISAMLLATVAGCNSPANDPQPRPPANETLPAKAEQNRPAPVAALPATAGAEPRGATATPPRLALDPDGLRWFLPPNGAVRPLAFGTTQADVLASLERVRGDAADGTNQDCGAGPVQYANWEDGLSLVFQKGRFVGWGLDGRAKSGITTADGIGIGTTRAQLNDAIGPPLEVRQTSLGTEFSAGQYHGLFDGAGTKARITDMWAGVSCVAR